MYLRIKFIVQYRNKDYHFVEYNLSVEYECCIFSSAVVLNIYHYVIDPRLPFTDSVEEFCLVQPLLKKSIRVSGYWMVFLAGGATMIDSFEHVDYMD